MLLYVLSSTLPQVKCSEWWTTHTAGFLANNLPLLLVTQDVSTATFVGLMLGFRILQTSLCADMGDTLNPLDLVRMALTFRLLKPTSLQGVSLNVSVQI